MLLPVDRFAVETIILLNEVKATSLQKNLTEANCLQKINLDRFTQNSVFADHIILHSDWVNIINDTTILQRNVNYH